MIPWWTLFTPKNHLALLSHVRFEVSVVRSVGALPLDSFTSRLRNSSLARPPVCLVSP